MFEKVWLLFVTWVEVRGGGGCVIIVVVLQPLESEGLHESLVVLLATHLTQGVKGII